MFFDKFKDSIKNSLIKNEDFKPFPKYSQREEWENSLEPEYKQELIKEAEKYLNYGWPILPAVRYLDYYRNGNRSNYECIFVKERRYPLLALTVAECLEGKGRFFDDIINGLWVTLDEATWIVPAHNQQVESPALPRFPLPDVIHSENIFLDLYSAESGAVISWIYYLLKDSLPEDVFQIPQRMQYEVNRRIITPFLENEYYWMGFDGRPVNNWNPWIISNVLFCTAVLCDDDNKKRAVIMKALDCLEHFINGYSEDGGCDEGPNYWSVAGSSLYDCLELIFDLTGEKVDLCNEPLIKNICAYIYKMHIDSNFFTNFADASPRLRPDCTLIYRMGKHSGDKNMIKLASALFNREQKDSGPYTPDGCNCLIYRYTKNFFARKELFKETNTEYPLLRDVYFKGIEVMAARSKEGYSNGLYLCAKGGNNDESHNHNDVGSFVIYCRGLPAIIDIGTGVYEKKTFSDRRYEILQMQSLYHNLPIIGDIGEMNGSQYKSKDVKYSSSEKEAVFSLDISGAYPDEAFAEKIKREFIFDREKDEVNLTDSIKLKKENEVSFVFMTPKKPKIEGSSLKLNLNEETTLTIDFDEKLQYSFDIFDSSKDRILNANWGNEVYRNIFKTKGKIKEGNFKFKFSM